MVLNGKLIVLSVVLFITTLFFGYSTFSNYNKVKIVEKKLEQALLDKKQLKQAYDDELFEQNRLSQYKTETLYKLKTELKDEPCFNATVPNSVIDSLYYKR